MKALLLSILLLGFLCTYAQKKYVGPPVNEGREYGNPKMPWMVSHLAGANRKMLERSPKNSHFILARVLCFRKSCRIQSGHSAARQPMTFKKFKKKVEKNAKKGVYKRPASDSTKRKPAPKAPEVKPVVVDTAAVSPPLVIQADSLIILGAELLFEINKATLRTEYFATLDSIVDYMILHPNRSVKISGHTDNTGSESHNLTLSKKRADGVAEYLVNNGVDINRVETFGFGSSKPLEVNSTVGGRKKNRRVELLLHDVN